MDSLNGLFGGRYQMISPSGEPACLKGGGGRGNFSFRLKGGAKFQNFWKTYPRKGWIKMRWTRFRAIAEAWRLNLRKIWTFEALKSAFFWMIYNFYYAFGTKPQKRVWNQSRSISKYLPSEAEFKLEINLNIQSKIKRVLMHERWWIGGGGLMGGFRKIFYLFQ